MRGPFHASAVFIELLASPAPATGPPRARGGVRRGAMVSSSGSRRCYHQAHGVAFCARGAPDHEDQE